MTEPIPIQIAFQGGGAKLAALLAATEAIQKQIEHKRIKVTRVAGTSAGSIAACLLAGGIPVGEVRSQLQNGKGKALIESFEHPGWLNIIWRLAWGNPLWDARPLRDWISSLFSEYELKKLSDLSKKTGIEAFVVSTDLANRSAVVSESSEFLANAILDSCALPFVFRVWNKVAGPNRVDGGICESLPVNVLLEQQAKLGEVIAVSFPASLPDPPTSLAKFSLALLDAAISSSMALTKSRLSPSFIIELKTSLGTFSFADALHSGLGNDYKNIKDETNSWIDEFIKRSGKGSSKLPKLDFWKDPSPATQSLLKDFTRLYESTFGNSPISYKLCRFSVTVHSLRQKDVDDPYEAAPDVAEFELHFDPVAEPLYAFAISMIAELPDLTHFLGSTACCKVLDSAGATQSFKAIPISDEVDPSARRLAIFFDKPLQPNSGTYKVVFREEGVRIMAELLRDGSEELSVFRPTRASGPVKRIELVLHAPESVPIGWIALNEADYSPIRQMNQSELGGIGAAHYTKTYGWVAENTDKKISGIQVIARQGKPT